MATPFRTRFAPGTDILGVRVTGLEAAERALNPALYDERLAKAIRIGSNEILVPAIRAVLGPHRWSGRAEASIHAMVRSEFAIKTGALASEVPELRPLTHGWYSRSAKQPPPERLAGWLSSKGADPKAAFVVARAIQQRGYKDEPRGINTFRVALRRSRAALIAVIAREMAPNAKP